MCYVVPFSVAALFLSAALALDIEDDVSMLQIGATTSHSSVQFWSDYTLTHAKTKEEFRAWGESLRASFESKLPYPSTSLDGLFDESMLRSCEQAMLNVPLEEWIPQTVSSHDGLMYDGKYRLLKDQWAFSDGCKMLADLQDNQHFQEFLSGIAGEDRLTGLPQDEGDSGGGTVLGIVNGGHLQVHTDYNIFPGVNGGRILTMMLYLNSDWHEDWGGDLEIWEQVNASDQLWTTHYNPLIKYHSKITPAINRAFLWRNGPFTYHGHPQVVSAPEGKMRFGLQYIWFRPQKLHFPNQGGLFMLNRSTTPAHFCEENDRTGEVAMNQNQDRLPSNDCYFSLLSA